MPDADAPLAFNRVVEPPTSALPQPYFTSSAWHRRDMDLVFRRQWLFAGHGSQIRDPGDYFTYEIDKDSVVITRDHRGVVHAFHNSCRHRGARICTERAGNAKAFMCPVHAWTYGLDGTLKVAPRMDVDKTLYPAVAVRVEEWNGMIFINLSDVDSRTVADRLVRADLEHYELGRTKVIHDKTYVIRANWKFSTETFIECYHCDLNHPTLVGLMDPLNGMEAWDPYAQGVHDDLVIFADDISCDFRRAGSRSFSADGHIRCRKSLGPAWRTETACLGWWTQFGMFVSPDYAYTLSWKPIDERTSEFRSTWLVHEDAVEGDDYDVDEVVALGNLINEEDKRICENYQIGVESSGYRPGPYHPVFESPVQVFNYLYLKQVGANPYNTG